MNTKIIASLLTILAVGAVATAGTVAYFTDEETSTGNTFTAGTIDISVDGQNPWIGQFTLGDMKPGYTDEIVFNVQNTGSDPNPVNIYKNLNVTSEATGAQSEPECTEESGAWDNATKVCSAMSAQNNNLSSAIVYDLKVDVYNSGGTKVWWQTIYVDSDNQTIDDVYYGGTAYDKRVYLGMIPSGGYMTVTQSYHLADGTTNWAQGDIMTFDIKLTAEQLKGVATLEDKTDAPDYKLVLGNGIEGTLTYKVKNPTFDFSFTGKAPLVSTGYTLLAVTDPWPQTGSKVLGTGTTDLSGNITITGNIDTGDLKDKKVWLIQSSDWNGTIMTGWHQTNYLLETGLIWYEDTGI